MLSGNEQASFTSSHFSSNGVKSITSWEEKKVKGISQIPSTGPLLKKNKLWWALPTNDNRPDPPFHAGSKNNIKKSSNWGYVSALSPHNLRNASSMSVRTRLVGGCKEKQ